MENSVMPTKNGMLEPNLERDFFAWARIIKPHGIKGEFRIMIDSDEPSQYEGLAEVFFKKKEAYLPYKVIELNFVSVFEAILSIEGIDHRSASEMMVNQEIYLPIELLPELSERGFYYHDIIGFKAWDEKLGYLGIIVDILESPAQDLIQIDYQTKELLIPIVDEFITSTDFDKSVINFNLPNEYLNLLEN